MRAHPYACVINVSGPVCGAQRLNVSYDHPEVKRKEKEKKEKKRKEAAGPVGS